MSNGSRFVTLWGETWKDAGYPVKVIWASHGKIADPVTTSGGLTVPTVFSTSANDYTSPPFPIAVGYQLTIQAGTPGLYLFSKERTLTATTYPRIPGVDATEANAIVAALKATGVWNAQGVRVVPDIQVAVSQAANAVLPASIYADGLANDVANETARILAAHQFTSEFLPQVDAFFGTYIPA